MPEKLEPTIEIESISPEYETGVLPLNYVGTADRRTEASIHRHGALADGLASLAVMVGPEGLEPSSPRLKGV